MKLYIILAQFCVGVAIGVTIACSPTKFSPAVSLDAVCEGSISCVEQQGFVQRTDSYEVGRGKTDILFVIDNSASMSSIQKLLAVKFNGFIANLDSKKIDYRIAVTTTDASQSTGLSTLYNGNSYLDNTTSNRVNILNAAIVRDETRKCEELIMGKFNTYGSSFQSNADYAIQYPQICASPDTRGIYTAYNVLFGGSASSFIRTDANLNIITISNDEVRQGKKTLETQDTAENFLSKVQETYALKFWNYNSIIVKDGTCLQAQSLKTVQGAVITGPSGQPAIAGGYGLEYAKISNSLSRDTLNNQVPRGKVLDICQSDYAQHFTDMEAQITDAARMKTLYCVPSEAPIVTYETGATVPSSLYIWNQEKVTFQKGSEGAKVQIQYKCPRGAK